MTLLTLTSARPGPASVLLRQCGHRSAKRWRDGQMTLRWCVTGMVEAGKQSAASTGTRTCNCCPTCWSGPRTCRCPPPRSGRQRSLMITEPRPKFLGTQDILRSGGVPSSRARRSPLGQQSWWSITSRGTVRRSLRVVSGWYPWASTAIKQLSGSWRDRAGPRCPRMAHGARSDHYAETIGKWQATA